MSQEVKIIPDRLREIVGLRENVDTHLRGLCRSKRRAIWGGVENLIRRGLFSVGAKLRPFVKVNIGGALYCYGALNRGGCTTLVGIVSRKLIIYSIIDRGRLLRRDGEEKTCLVLDEEISTGGQRGRVRVFVVGYRYMIWSASVRIVSRVVEHRAHLLEFLPQGRRLGWQPA